MALRWQDWPPRLLAALRKGVVIPAHPLALDANRKLDDRVCAAYPHLNDNAFVRANLRRWLS